MLGKLVVGLGRVRPLLHHFGLFVGRLSFLALHAFFGSLVWLGSRLGNEYLLWYLLLLRLLGNGGLAWALHALCGSAAHRLTVRDGLALVLDKLAHLLFDDVHLQDLNDVGAVLWLLLDHHHDQLVKFTAVAFGDRHRLTRNDFEDEVEEVVRLESVLKRTQLMEDAAEGPHVRLRRLWL